MPISRMFLRFICSNIFLPIITISTSYAVNVASNQAQFTQPTQSSENTTYQTVCATCHDSGINNAPRIHDHTNWQNRSHQGLSVLYSHVINGYNRMPPLGGCVTCTNEDIKDAVDYILASNMTPNQFKSISTRSGENALTQTSPLTSTPNPMSASSTEQMQSANNIQHNSGLLTTAQKKLFDEIMASGKKNYDHFCASCHGVGGNGTVLNAPALRKGLYSSSYITTDKPISRQIDTVLQGVPDTIMMPFGQMLTDTQLASINTYIRNAWGNSTGDIVTDKDIQQERNETQQKNKVNQNTYIKFSYEDLMAQGKINYRAFCARCHQIDGKGKAPFGTNLQNSFVAHDPELIGHRIAIVLNGIPGTRMRGYGTQLTDQELASLLTYIANGWGEHGKQTIQPNDIYNARTELAKIAQSPENDADKTMTFKQLMSLGRVEYMSNCARCHMPDGKGEAQPGVPSLIRSPITTGNSISTHIDLVLTGVPSSIMRTYAPRLTDTEIAAIITYERNAWGNNTGDIIQSSAIEKERTKLQKQIEYQSEHQLVQQYYNDEKIKQK